MNRSNHFRCFLGCCALATVAAVCAPQPRLATVSPSDPAQLPSAAFLGLLPEGETKQKFILDCAGCHVFDERIAFAGGRPRTEAEWVEIVRRMLGYAGAHTPFPVIAADRDPEETARWLVRHLDAPPTSYPPSPAARGEITEFPIPEPRDLPHDVAVNPSGQVVITGMFTDRMYLLDPETGTFTTQPIPVPRANPRALEIDAAGHWWVLLGMPGQIARYDPAADEWKTWEIGMYAHEVRVDSQGRAWFNGHFSRAPEVIGYVDIASGQTRTFQVPPHPEVEQSGPIPYGVRIGPEGTVWGTELHGGRLIRLDPAAERFQTYDLPTRYGGPRRIDVDASGRVWIPEYAANKLTRFDPQTERFTEYPLPIPDALPYIAEVDRQRNIVWIGTGAADAILAFHPDTERFTVYPLPTRGALVRHLAIDPRTGDLWAAYGASPGIPSQVARLRMPR